MGVELTMTIDYRYPTTIPMEGETLGTGKLQRKFGEAVLRLAHKVISFFYLNLMHF
jgi:hypothetical protein